MDALAVAVIFVAILGWIVAPWAAALLVSIYRIFGLKMGETWERVILYSFRLVSAIIIVFIVIDALRGSPT